MRMIVLLMLVIGSGWWLAGQRGDDGNPEVIENPVYLEHRMDFRVPGDVINAVLFVKTPDEEDCHERTRRVWQKYLEGCADCVFKSHECKTTVSARYLKAMDGASLETTFLRASRGSRHERSGVIVLWGLNQRDADRVCQDIKARMGKQYSGVLECVRPAGA